MTKTLSEFVWVYVGCGGTFYAATPYLAVLQRRYKPAMTVLFDPDMLEEKNQDRQWPGYVAGYSKVRTGMVALDDSFPFEAIQEKFNPRHPTLMEATRDKPVLVIVNVDNHRGRLDVARWLASRMDSGIMVVSGCERNFGQCYPGIWYDGEPVLDWREFHPDVNAFEEDEGSLCNPQTIKSNAMTGVLVGACLEDVARWLADESSNHLFEFYWTQQGNTGLKMWETPVLVGRREAQ